MSISQFLVILAFIVFLYDAWFHRSLVAAGLALLTLGAFIL